MASASLLAARGTQRLSTALLAVRVARSCGSRGEIDTLAKDVFARVEPMGWSRTGNRIRVGLRDRNALREAFAIAVLIFVPFLVIDLVVGLALAALGWSSPQAIALPLKLLLFVSVDGWSLPIDGL